MKLGVKKIEYIGIGNVADFSYMPAGSQVNLANFITDGAVLQQLDFTQETANMEDHWVDDDKGRRSAVKVTGCIRTNKEAWFEPVRRLLGKHCIWKITLVNGQKFVLGSRKFVPNFSFDDTVSGISSSEIGFSISLTSTHGLFRSV